MKSPVTRFSSVITLSSTRTAVPSPQGFHVLRQGFIPPRERSISYLKPEHQGRVADAYHAFKDVEGFAKVATLDEIRANDGNLSIPLYVRGKAVSEEKGVYAANGLREAMRVWERSSNKLRVTIISLTDILTNKRG